MSCDRSSGCGQSVIDSLNLRVYARVKVKIIRVGIISYNSLSIGIRGK